MSPEPEQVEAKPVAYTHKGKPVSPARLPHIWKPGQCGNPKGGPRGPRRNANDELRRYFEEEVKREIPDGEGNPRVVKVARLELFVRMVGAACFKTDGDPGFRRDCVKYVWERLGPVVSAREWEPFVEQGQYTTEVGRNFLSELEQAAGLMPVTPTVVLAVLQRGNGNGRSLIPDGDKEAEQQSDGAGI